MPLKYNPERDEEPPSTTAFWTVALVFLLGALAVGGYYVYRPAEVIPPPKPVVKARRLAPEGTFYVVNYISARIKSGVIGFEPGRQVHLVKVLHDKQKLIVSDGTYEVEADPGMLTNDIDIADLARSHDAASQTRIASFQSMEKERYEEAIRQENVAHAKDVSSFSQGIAKGSVVGTYDNPLNKGSEPTRSIVYPTGYYYGSPYSYFNGPYHPAYYTTY